MCAEITSSSSSSAPLKRLSARREWLRLDMEAVRVLSARYLAAFLSLLSLGRLFLDEVTLLRQVRDWHSPLLDFSHSDNLVRGPLELSE